MTIYDRLFDQAINGLHSEGRYRMFIGILRNKGAYARPINFPTASLQ